MLLIAFACFAVLILAWLLAPGEAKSLPSMLRMEMPEPMTGEVELQH